MGCGAHHSVKVLSTRPAFNTTYTSSTESPCLSPFDATSTSTTVWARLWGTATTALFVWRRACITVTSTSR